MAAELVSTNKQHIGNNTLDIKEAKWPSEGKGGVPPRTLIGLQCVAGKRTVYAGNKGRKEFVTCRNNKLIGSLLTKPTLRSLLTGNDLVSRSCFCPVLIP